MSLFITEDGSALEKPCLLDDDVGVSAWAGSRLVVGAAAILRGGGSISIESRQHMPPWWYWWWVG